MKWINFLHFYQPANMEKEKVIEACEKSYSFILDQLEKNPDTKVTANLSGSLIIRFAEELGFNDLLSRFSRLISSGQIEIVGSAAYHPLLPLVKKKIAIRQIEEQEELLKKCLNCAKPKGFFFPEMAYTPEAGAMIKKLGYEWIILDEISAGGLLNKIDASKIFIDKENGLKIIFRSRYWSSSYVPKHFLDEWQNIENKTIVTATDAELYGLKHEDHSGNLSELLKKEGLETTTISEHINSANNAPEALEVLPSSWETTEEEIKAGRPFELWSADDKIHEKLWKLADLAQKLYLKHESCEAGFWCYWHLVRGLGSCTFWWASGKDFKHNFGPRAWNPDEIEKGINELIRSIRSLEKFTDLKIKLKAEKMAIETKKLIWEKHWRDFN